MKISIIIPAYKRPFELMRAVKSVLEQGYKNWEMVVVNDSPEYNFKPFEVFLDSLDEEEKNKIKYFINSKNMGGNWSRNFGLEKTSPDSNFVFFLDHDDWLTNNSLKDQVDIVKRENCKWLLTLNRSNGKDLNIDSIKITKNDKRYYDYMNDYLIKRKTRGDYAQLIDLATIRKNNIEFSKKVKKGQTLEEWIFSMRFSRYSKCFVENIITLEKEYQKDSLTNLEKTNKKFKNRFENFSNTIKACREVFFEGFYPLEKVYIFIKILRAFQKLLF